MPTSPQEFINKRDNIRRIVDRGWDTSKVSQSQIKDLIDAASCYLEELDTQDDMTNHEKYSHWMIETLMSLIKWPVRQLWVEFNVRYVVGGKVEARFDPEIIDGHREAQGEDFLWTWDGGEKTMQEDEMRFERGTEGMHIMKNPAPPPWKTTQGIKPGFIEVPVVYDRCFMFTRMQNEEIMDMFKNYHTDHLDDVRHDQ